jgi:hypothetical protein
MLKNQLIILILFAFVGEIKLYFQKKKLCLIFERKTR